ncbi:MAG: hypothetical protein Unbinned4162contig1001_63 [Prokaryotic dsDNA virus sp.]|nr:MAG: hypothetical protein Unbinned4162contig1001_63 [Prokaryotic dsDNA virus sp.]|tara:strand:- start:45708 stop:46121 length:414 start_codon:yes stop_codon:yes gene_type:complete
MSQLYITKALQDAVIAAAGSTPLELPQQTLNKSQKGGLWLKLTFIRGQSTVATLGDQGEDNAPGIAQIDVCYPKGKGEGEVLAKVDDLVKLFPAGSSFTYGGQWVKLLGVSAGGERTVAGTYKISITLRYYARYKRR